MLDVMQRQGGVWPYAWPISHAQRMVLEVLRRNGVVEQVRDIGGGLVYRIVYH